MTTKISIPHLLGISGCLLLLVFLISLPHADIFNLNASGFSLGIILDFVVTLPILYFLLIRRSTIPKFTVVYVVVLGIILAGFVLPQQNQEFLSQLKRYLIPTLEFGIIGFLMYRMNQLRKSYTQEANRDVDFYNRLETATSEIFPGRIGKLLSTEIAVFYYLLSFKSDKEIAANEFSYSKNNGIKSIIGALLFVLLIEAGAVHFLLERWSTTAAWIATILSLYASFQILAILRSMNKRLILIDYKSKKLNLNYGFACKAIIPFEQISTITLNKKKPSGKMHAHLSIFDIIETPNVIIYVNETHTLQKLYGIKKEFNSISIYVDEKDAFVAAINDIIPQIGSTDA